MDGFVARRGWIRAMRFEYGENRKVLEDTASSKEQHIGLDLSDTILQLETAHKERRFRHLFSPKHSPSTQRVYGLAGRRHCHHHPQKEEIIRPSHRPTGDSEADIASRNFHHHAPFIAFNSKEHRPTLPKLP